MPLIPDFNYYSNNKSTKVEDAYKKLFNLNLELKLCKSTNDPPDSWIAATPKYADRTIAKHNDRSPPGSDVEPGSSVGVTLVGGIEPTSSSKQSGDLPASNPGVAAGEIGPHSQVVQIGMGPCGPDGGVPILAGRAANQPTAWMLLAIGFAIGLALGMVLVLAFGKTA